MLQALLDSLEEDLKYAIEVEGKMAVADITNYDQVNSAAMCNSCGNASLRRPHGFTVRDTFVRHNCLLRRCGERLRRRWRV
jgi:hypothetical protein